MEKNYYNDNTNYFLTKHNMLFINIPKVASTTLWSICAELETGFITKTKEEIRSFKIPTIKTSQITKFPQIIKIGFVRNPYDRLVSVYRNKIKKNDASFLKNTGLSGGTSFSNFVDYVSKTPDYSADKHFRSQFTFIFDHQAELIIDYLGRLESFSEDIENIKQKYQLPISSIPQLNSEANTSYQQYYSDDLVAKINKRYKLDIELFNYNYNTELLPNLRKLQNADILEEQRLEILKYKSCKLLRIVKQKEKYDAMPKGVYGLFLRKYKEYFTNYFNEDLDP